MVKTVTLRCPDCGNTYTFNIGADASLAGWREILARMNNSKECAKLNDMYMKIAETRNKIEQFEFVQNPAEALNNIPYALCGEESLSLIDPEVADVSSFIGEKAQESIAASDEKWKAALQKSGILGFEAMYLCPKTRHPKQGIHVSVRYKDEKQKDVLYVYRNACGDCGTNMVLLNDENAGFMHVDCPTIARCEHCNKQLWIDKVSFKIAQNEQ